jgi:NAD(P)-dependent dehydrogenase (short-subunit alcohol dehydrogenase family)
VTTVGIATGAGRGMGLACARRIAAMVDRLLLVDLDEAAAAAAAAELSATGGAAAVEPFVLDITDADGLARLSERVGKLGTLRAVAHAAGISPTMADWRRVFRVDLVGTALLAQALRPRVTTGTVIVCFASMAPILGVSEAHPADAALDDPLHEHFLDRIHDALGSSIENSGMAYMWAKRGVHRFVRQEAVRLGPLGGRICSISPGLIDTPMNAQEMASSPFMKVLLERTPLGRLGSAEELAAVAAFLLSDAASFLSGTDVLVDGGVCAAIHAAPQTR